MLKDEKIVRYVEHRLLTITSVIIFIEFAAIVYAKWYRQGIELWNDTFTREITLPIVLFPILFSILMWVIFHRIERLKKYKRLYLSLQIFPIFLNIICLIVSTVTLVDETTKSITPETFSDSSKGETEKQIDKAVMVWIKDNTKYPESYEPISFDHYYTFYKTDHDVTCSGIVTEEDAQDDKHLMYLVIHKCRLKDISGETNVVKAQFKLSKNFEILSVRFPDEVNISNAVQYAWREKYGNEKRNLELEKLGIAYDTCYAYLFNWNGQLAVVAPFCNGKIEGTAYEFVTDQRTDRMVARADTEKINTFYNNVVISAHQYRTGITQYAYDNGYIRAEGIEIRNKRIGRWLFYDSHGKVSHVEQYNDESGARLLDSLHERFNQ